MENRITPENITKLKRDEVFVFGSNEAGIHGAGAAKLALEKFGAKLGYGNHWIGKSYGIPTKDKDLKTLKLAKIQNYINKFISTIKGDNIDGDFSYIKFYVTEIGCGLAGYTPEQIAPMFKEAVNLKNVYLPKRFWDVLNKK